MSSYYFKSLNVPRPELINSHRDSKQAQNSTGTGSLQHLTTNQQYVFETPGRYTINLVNCWSPIVKQPTAPKNAPFPQSGTQKPVSTIQKNGVSGKPGTNGTACSTCSFDEEEFNEHFEKRFAELSVSQT